MFSKSAAEKVRKLKFLKSLKNAPSYFEVERNITSDVNEVLSLLHWQKKSNYGTAYKKSRCMPVRKIYTVR